MKIVTPRYMTPVDDLLSVAFNRLKILFIDTYLNTFFVLYFKHLINAF